MSSKIGTYIINLKSKPFILESLDIVIGPEGRVARDW